MRKTFEILSLQLRICNHFEIIRSVYSNSRLTQVFKRNTFFNLLLEFSQIWYITRLRSEMTQTKVSPKILLMKSSVNNFIFFLCILLDYVSHESLKEFWPFLLLLVNFPQPDQCESSVAGKGGFNFVHLAWWYGSQLCRTPPNPIRNWIALLVGRLGANLSTDPACLFKTCSAVHWYGVTPSLFFLYFLVGF